MTIDQRRDALGISIASLARRAQVDRNRAYRYLDTDKLDPDEVARMSGILDQRERELRAALSVA